MSGWPFDPQHVSQYDTTSTIGEPDALAAQIALANAQRRAAANRNLIVGAILFAVGLGFTIATYSMASDNPNGGTYLVAWGPMLFGFIRMMKGITSR